MRYALYFAPPEESALWQFGSRWLGYDAATGQSWSATPVSGWSQDALSRITAEPRRYGFHATLKAPFRLAGDCTETQLLAACAAFARSQPPLLLGPLAVAPLQAFIALQPVAAPAQLGAWAFACVRAVDRFRALPTLTELQHRQRSVLSQRQQALLTAWGYPYVDDQFRFHMTLTGALAPAEQQQLLPCLQQQFAPLAGESVRIEALSLFVEPAPGAPFRLQQRFALTGGN
jgi:putative phosphonate metabolism protein